MVPGAVRVSVMVPLTARVPVLGALGRGGGNKGKELDATMVPRTVQSPVAGAQS